MGVDGKEGGGDVEGDGCDILYKFVVVYLHSTPN